MVTITVEFKNDICTEGGLTIPPDKTFVSSRGGLKGGFMWGNNESPLLQQLLRKKVKK